MLAELLQIPAISAAADSMCAEVESAGCIGSTADTDAKVALSSLKKTILLLLCLLLVLMLLSIPIKHLVPHWPSSEMC